MYTCVYVYMYVCMYIHINSFLAFVGPFLIQGGEDSQNPLSSRSFSTKEPLNIGHFCGK